MNIKANTTQINDNMELLELMMNDTKAAPDIFRPTNYWQNYEKIFLPELRAKGLKDFRRRKNSVLSSFGATDLMPLSRHLDHLTIWGKNVFAVRVINQLLKIKQLYKLYNYISRAITGANLEDIRLLYYEIAKGYGGKNNAKPISELEASIIGNPEDLFSVNGKLFTTSILYYYIQYAYCSQFMDYSNINAIMELGSGSGKQIEVIKKLHPEMCFYIFDIPPQLYICEQYLSALFPDCIVSYAATRKMKILPENREGKIFIFGNWKMPEIEGLSYDLFINSASFQEMEPEVVLNYLNYVDEQTTMYIFLHEMMEGKNQAIRKGEAGVLKPTKLVHYKQGLKHFQLLDLSTSIILTQMTAPYEFSFWKRNQI